MKVTITGDGMGPVKESIEWLKTHKVRIGIPDNGVRRDEGLSNAELAFLMTNGSPVNRMPPRPFLEPALEQPDVKEQIVRHMKQAAQDALDGNFDTAMNGLHKAGLAGQSAVKSYMIDGSFEPNAGITINGGWMRNRVSGKPVYIKGKHSSRPLIDTGNLQGAITYIVE